MAHRNELQFDDPVDRSLPSGFGTPQRSGRAITLADLATHTSGLPLFPPITGNPFEALPRYTAADLRSWLSDLTLSRDPGAEWEYSNVGRDQALGWEVVTRTDPFVVKDGVTAGQAASIVLDVPK